MFSQSIKLLQFKQVILYISGKTTSKEALIAAIIGAQNWTPKIAFLARHKLSCGGTTSIDGVIKQEIHLRSAGMLERQRRTSSITAEEWRAIGELCSDKITVILSVVHASRWPSPTFLTYRKALAKCVDWLTSEGQLVLRTMCYSYSLLILVLYEIHVPLLSSNHHSSKPLVTGWKILPTRVGCCWSTSWVRCFLCEDNKIDWKCIQPYC